MNVALDILGMRLTKILNTVAPMKTYQIRKNYNPWISRETLEMMKNRDQLHKVASQSNITEDWTVFKKIRNQINNRLKYEEKRWQSEKLRQCNGNAKSSWKTLKSILNWNISGAPTKLFYKGELKTKLQEVADCQNESFIDKIKEIQQELPAQKDDLMKFLKIIS